MFAFYIGQKSLQWIKFLWKSVARGPTYKNFMNNLNNKIDIAKLSFNFNFKSEAAVALISMSAPNYQTKRKLQLNFHER